MAIVETMPDSPDGETCVECGTIMKLVSNIPKFVACPNSSCGMYRGVMVSKY